MGNFTIHHCIDIQLDGYVIAWVTIFLLKNEKF